MTEEKNCFIEQYRDVLADFNLRATVAIFDICDENNQKGAQYQRALENIANIALEVEKHIKLWGILNPDVNMDAKRAAYARVYDSALSMLHQINAAPVSESVLKSWMIPEDDSTVYRDIDNLIAHPEFLLNRSR